MTIASPIETVEQLEALYGAPGEAALVKELDRIIPEYAALIEASPFVALATSGRKGSTVRRAEILPVSCASTMIVLS